MLLFLSTLPAFNKWMKHILLLFYKGVLFLKATICRKRSKSWHHVCTQIWIIYMWPEFSYCLRPSRYVSFYITVLTSMLLTPVCAWWWAECQYTAHSVDSIVLHEECRVYTQYVECIVQQEELMRAQNQFSATKLWFNMSRDLGNIVFKAFFSWTSVLDFLFLRGWVWVW